MTADSFDPVERPYHYNWSEIQPIDVIEAWGLGFHEGQVVKYLGRAGFKGDGIEDLKKANFYLARHIKNLEAKKLEQQEDTLAETVSSDLGSGVNPLPSLHDPIPLESDNWFRRWLGR